VHPLTTFPSVVFALSNSTAGVPNTDYIDVGLMGETVWGYLLSDLHAENHTTQATEMESLMRIRQQLWSTLPDPYGSEMAWDSTGEEGVYYWSIYFNDNTTAQKTIDAIRGYMPTVAHWGWNGNARRYWDFLYAGQIQLARYERQIHHYGSGLNALPMLSNYRLSQDPESLEAIYDLRVGYGGNQGPLSNIDAGGFGSMAFHSYPNTLKWDAYSGDYGPNFLGHVLGAATYLVEHPIFSWISFGGNVDTGNGSLITVEPRDSVNKRIFVAPVSLYVTIDAGTITSLTYNIGSEEVVVSIAGDGAAAAASGYGSNELQQVVLNWEQTAQQSATKMQLSTSGLQQGLGGYLLQVPTTGATTVKFTCA